MEDYSGITGLLEKLAKARFTGSLSIRFEAGQPASAELKHLIPFADFTSRELPGIEAHEAEFSLKP